MKVIQLTIDCAPTSWAIHERNPAAHTRPPRAPTATNGTAPVAWCVPVGAVVETVMLIPDPWSSPSGQW